LIEAIQNALRSPEIREHLVKKFAEQEVSALSTSSVRTLLDEALGLAGKIRNPHDTDKIAHLVSLALEPKQDGVTLADKMARFWQPVVEKERDVAGMAEDVSGVVGTATQTLHKIHFTNSPAVNLGAAITALGGAIFVGNHFAKNEKVSSESKGKKGETVITIEERKAPFWKRMVRNSTVLALLGACGIAVARAGLLPNRSGISFVGRIIEGGVEVVSKGR
jgi:hypothetical protein